MLTLTRRAGESIAIGDDVEITVVDIGRGKVRLAIRAPRGLSIHRAEVLDRIAASIVPDERGTGVGETEVSLKPAVRR